MPHRPFPTAAAPGGRNRGRQEAAGAGSLFVGARGEERLWGVRPPVGGRIRRVGRRW